MGSAPPCPPPERVWSVSGTAGTLADPVDIAEPARRTPVGLTIAVGRARHGAVAAVAALADVARSVAAVIPASADLDAATARIIAAAALAAGP